MRILIAEDDMASCKCLLKFFSQYGDCDITADIKKLEVVMTKLGLERKP